MTNKLYADGKGPSYSYTSDGKLARRVWARGIATDYTYKGKGDCPHKGKGDCPHWKKVIENCG